MSKPIAALSTERTCQTVALTANGGGAESAQQRAVFASEFRFDPDEAPRFEHEFEVWFAPGAPCPFEVGRRYRVEVTIAEAPPT